MISARTVTIAQQRPSHVLVFGSHVEIEFRDFEGIPPQLKQLPVQHDRRVIGIATAGGAVCVNCHSLILL